MSGGDPKSIEGRIKEIRAKLESMESPEQRASYLSDLVHGHNWFVETLQKGLDKGLGERDLDKFLESEIQAQKIYWRSVRDRI